MKNVKTSPDFVRCYKCKKEFHWIFARCQKCGVVNTNRQLDWILSGEMDIRAN